MKEYNKHSEYVWNKILNVEKILSDKEADEMLETVKKIRKEHGFRTN